VHGQTIEGLYWRFCTFHGLRAVEPESYEIITVGGMIMRRPITVNRINRYEDFVSWEFWRLENAYDDLKYNKKTGDKLV
jgi:hypothetical protein